MMLRTMICLTVAILAMVSHTGCVHANPTSAKTMVWRASNDYGDKPGNGLELSLQSNAVSGTFFLLEPSKPHDFKSGPAFPLKILERRGFELVCEVRYNENFLDKFVLKLPQNFPRREFTAILQDVKPGTTPMEFNFKRVK